MTAPYKKTNKTFLLPLSPISQIYAGNGWRLHKHFTVNKKQLSSANLEVGATESVGRSSLALSSWEINRSISFNSLDARAVRYFCYIQYKNALKHCHCAQLRNKTEIWECKAQYCGVMLSGPCNRDISVFITEVPKAERKRFLKAICLVFFRSLF